MNENSLKLSVFPWDLPLSQGIIKTLPVMVFIYNLRSNDDIIHQMELDLGNVENRKYLGKVTAWAVLNNCAVETMSKNDAEGCE
jgi:hypothetical protein